MKALLHLFRFVHGLMAALFAAAALMLISIAARTGWLAYMGGLDAAAAQVIIEAVGLLAAAVVALQISETIFEEEAFARRTSARRPAHGGSCRGSSWSSWSRWPSRGWWRPSRPCTKIRPSSRMRRVFWAPSGCYSLPGARSSSSIARPRN